VDVEPARLFGRVGPQSATFDRLFLLVSSESSEIAVEPVDPLDVGERMLFSLQHERLDFTAAYLKYRFSFPAAVNPFIEELEELERKALARAFAGKPAFVAHHPYPCSLDALRGDEPVLREPMTGQRSELTVALIGPDGAG
jgi:hypothetical protein